MGSWEHRSRSTGPPSASCQSSAKAARFQSANRFRTERDGVAEGRSQRRSGEGRRAAPPGFPVSVKEALAQREPVEIRTPQTCGHRPRGRSPLYSAAPNTAAMPTARMATAPSQGWRHGACPEETEHDDRRKPKDTLSHPLARSIGHDPLLVQRLRQYGQANATRFGEQAARVVNRRSAVPLPGSPACVHTIRGEAGWCRW